MRLELVVAHYNEDITWLNRVPTDWQITLFHKGNDLPVLARGHARRIENIGREGETFLHHIIKRYDLLSDMTLFVQGNPFDHISETDFFALLDKPGTSVRPVGNWLTCGPEGSPHHPGLPLDLFALVCGMQVNYPLGFCPGAMWLVSRDVIQAKPRSYYEFLRKQLLAGDIYGYCLKRLWPVLWDYSVEVPRKKVYGLMYSHHKVPDKVLALSLATINGMGIPDDDLVISCWREDNRFPERACKVFHTPSDSHWLPAIYEQIIAGLEVLPADAYVLTLEHDILYPMTYLDQMEAAMMDPDLVYYYTLVRHLDLRAGRRKDFWASDENGTRTLQSCCGGRVDLLLKYARADLAAYRAGSLNKDFELGLPHGWARVDGEQPVLDLRCGTNSTDTGYDKEIYFSTHHHPYWGHAHQLRNRLR